MPRSPALCPSRTAEPARRAARAHDMVPAGQPEDSPVQKSLHSGRGNTEEHCVRGCCVKGHSSDVLDVPGDYHLFDVLDLGGTGVGGVAVLILHRRNAQELAVIVVVRDTADQHRQPILLSSIHRPHQFAIPVKCGAIWHLLSHGMITLFGCWNTR